MAKVIDAIRALERDRFRAMVDGDGVALDHVVARVRQGGGQPRGAVLEFAVGVVAAGLGDRHRVRHASGDSCPDGSEGDVHPSS